MIFRFIFERVNKIPLEREKRISEAISWMEAFMKNNLCSAIGLNKDIVDNVVNNVVDDDVINFCQKIFIALP